MKHTVDQANDIWDEIQQHNQAIKELQDRLHQLLVVGENWVYYGEDPNTWIVDPIIIDVQEMYLNDKENAAYYGYAFFVGSVD